MCVFKIVVVVLERAAGVVGRINEDALHPPRVERQQGFQGFEIIALYKQVFRLLVTIGVLCNGFQQAVRDSGGSFLIFGTGQPVELGHDLGRLLPLNAGRNKIVSHRPSRCVAMHSRVSLQLR